MEDFIKGRGAQFNSSNKFLSNRLTTDHLEGLDEPLLTNEKTVYLTEFPNSIVNKVNSPDLGLAYSLNPYQGCEHGCIYCYARNSHEYWGYSAGLDFERKIIVKKNAPELLKAFFDNPKWIPHPIMLSGNTDCYQPIERKLKITQDLLKVFLAYRHPVSIITKNSLIIRDIDLLKEMSLYNLVNVNITITSLNESLRLAMEPRTATSGQRLKTVESLSKAGIPVNIMIAPIIPSLNNHEIPEIMKEASQRGATSAGYTMVRLNGAIKTLFEDWIRKAFPDRAEKVLNQIAACHGGKLSDSRWGVRMKGEGNIAKSIETLFMISKQKYFKGNSRIDLCCSLFKRPERGQLNIF
ncbi:MAG TPA: PA0069 family radical SAM protein [Cytophagaceae bacterium]|jgi:DNA repair photolyase